MLNSFTFQATSFSAGLLLGLALLRAAFALRSATLLRASAH